MDAQEHRRLAAEALLEATGGDAAFHRIYVRRSDTGSLVAAGGLAVGDPALAARFAALDGRPVAELGVSFESAPPFRSFGLLDSADLASLAQRETWRALGIGQAVAMSFEADGHLLGALFSVRAGGRPGFQDGEIAAANRLRTPLAARLRRAAALERKLASNLGPVVFDGDGEIRMAASDVDPQSPAIRQLGRRAADHLNGHAPALVVDRRAFVELHVVTDGSERLVVAISVPVLPMAVHPAMRLTPLRRQVAGWAARGDTASAIAAASGRSEETVRTHLKHLYGALGVTTRVELAEVIRGLWR